MPKFGGRLNLAIISANALVAQWTEQRTSNPQVARSSRAEGIEAQSASSSGRRALCLQSAFQNDILKMWEPYTIGREFEMSLPIGGTEIALLIVGLIAFALLLAVPLINRYRGRRRFRGPQE